LPIRDVVEAALQQTTALEVLDDGVVAHGNPDGLDVLSLDPTSLRLHARPVAAFAKRRAPERLVRVITRSGRTITATPYHPLFTLVDGRLTSLKADELRIGTPIALPRCLPVRRPEAPRADLLSCVEQRCEASRAGLLEVCDQIEELGRTSHSAT